MSGLTARDEAKRLSTPPLQGRGRGWGVDAARLEELHARAKEMRNNPTEPEKRLWRALSRKQIGAKFRRQAVIPPYIADFLCPALKLILEVDGDTHDAAIDTQRDARLSVLGYRVLRFSNADVIGNIDGVFAKISETIEALRAPHPNPSPEREGLKAVEAQKLLGISLEGSVG
jgi:very-short-patch-repair endonuclease